MLCRRPPPCQVLDAKVVLDRPGRPGAQPQRIAECTVGDATGIILFTARNEQGGWAGRDAAGRGGAGSGCPSALASCAGGGAAAPPVPSASRGGRRLADDASGLRRRDAALCPRRLLQLT